MTPPSSESRLATTALLDPYFAGIAAEELRFQWCPACKAFQWPPRSLCPVCGNFDLAWRSLENQTGHVFTWTVTHNTPLSDFSERTPYVTALIDLPEAGIRVYGLIAGSAPDAIRFGMAVEPVFVLDNPSEGLVWRESKV